MTSTVLSYRKNSALNIFTWTLRKNLPAICVSSIVVLLATLGTILPNYLQRSSELYTDYSYGGASRYSTNDFLPGMIITCLICAGLVVLFSAMNFNYLHSKKTGDMFHALPLKRNTLLLSRFFAAAVSASIPAIIGYGSYIILGLIIPPLNFTPYVLMGLAVTVIFIFICTVFAAFFAVVCGSPFDMIVSMGVVNFGWTVVYFIFSTYCLSNLYGYGGDNQSYGIFSAFLGSSLSNIFSPFSVLITAFISFNPFYEVYTSAFDPVQTGKLLHIIYWVVGAAALMLVTLYLNKHRKNENAGLSFAYKIGVYIIQAICTIIGGFVVGMIFSLADAGSLTFHVFFVVGALLSAIIYGAVSARGFKTVLKSLIAGAVVTALSLTIFFGFANGGFGYETKQPRNPDSLQYVMFGTSGLDKHPYSSEPVKLTEKANIAAVYDLHKKIIENRNSVRARNVQNEVGGYFEDSGGTIWVSFEYPNGLKRSYTILEGDYSEELKTIASKEYLRALQPVFSSSFNIEDYKDRTISAQMYDTDGMSSSGDTISYDNFVKIVDTFKEEFDKLEDGEFNLDKSYQIYFNVYDTNYKAGSVDGFYMDGISGFSLLVDKTFTKTVQLCIDLGMKLDGAYSMYMPDRLVSGSPYDMSSTPYSMPSAGFSSTLPETGIGYYSDDLSRTTSTPAEDMTVTMVPEGTLLTRQFIYDNEEVFRPDFNIAPFKNQVVSGYIGYIYNRDDTNAIDISYDDLTNIVKAYRNDLDKMDLSTYELPRTREARFETNPMNPNSTNLGMLSLMLNEHFHETIKVCAGAGIKSDFPTQGKTAAAATTDVIAPF